MTEAAVLELGVDAVDEAAEALADAFAAYPTTAWFFEHSPIDRREALTALLRFFVTARTMRGEPVLGVRLNGDLAAVALASSPDGGASPPGLAPVREALWAHVGGEARRRYETYGTVLEPLLGTPVSLHVNLLGVRPAYRGRGLAGRLLDHLHVRATANMDGRGVSLSTEDPANLALYRHLGYEVTGSAVVAPDITAWVMRREVDPLDVARALAPRLGALPWAVGGSVLLRRLGIDVRPNDLDLVTSVERFDEVAAVLADALGPGDRPAHDTHRSQRFLRFSRGQGPGVDLMAGVRAQEGSSVREWHLDPGTVTNVGGVPWSRAEDWVTLYSLFGRAERAEALRRHLLERR
jgi:ribosomal protein S18 acetylase RimI-like enzyme